MAKKSTPLGSRTRANNLKSSQKAENSPKNVALKSSSATKATSQKSAPKKQAPPETHSKRKTSPEKAQTKKKHPRGTSEHMDSVVFERTRVGARSSRLSGDLQGLSNVADADSESVDELLEEGNAFEAGIVKGVEDSPYPEEGDIRTREFPEDDVPNEYLDEP
jgi:hypothetical protein